ncbi:hypothetical protein G5B46_04505 [Caulobacter sp. 602-2]|uniref:Uncharacterized protein n=1 Tax=Caulobacter sp. 602-2 TaxID=2710887 RepID=A0A6G4QTU5_9CAUL|nr:hypothetical protein [Caulobacter sp. 602-2]NGM48859.1 hypothetical protein [Caulobacter sp. 602-2]
MQAAPRKTRQETPARDAEIVSLAQFNHARSMKALERWDIGVPADPYPFAYCFPREGR